MYIIQHSRDARFLAEACWNLKELTDYERIEEIVRSCAIPPVMLLLKHDDSIVIYPVLLILANISSLCNQNQLCGILNASAFPLLASIMISVKFEAKPYIIETAAWTVRSLLCHSESRDDPAIPKQLLPSLVHLLNDTSAKTLMNETQKLILGN